MTRVYSVEIFVSAGASGTPETIPLSGKRSLILPEGIDSM